MVLKSSFIVIVAVIIANCSAIQVKLPEAIVTGCRADTSLSDADYARLETNDFENGSEAMKGYARCTLIKNNFLDKNGDIDATFVVEELTKKQPELADVITRAVDKCKVEKGTSVNDTAYKQYVCYAKF